jgi:hypothetical protein
VKVGRPALDEDAIRWIEEHNPDIVFNWQKILEAQPPAAASSEEAKPRRGRRAKGSARQGPRELTQVQAAEPERSATPVEPEPSLRMEIEDSETDLAAEPLVEEDLAEAFEQLTHPDLEEKVEPTATPVEQLIGREQLVRLRARYAELQARITERGGDSDRVEGLRSQAEPLDPDSWVTEDEARHGMELFEAKMRELRAALGLRRRRRSRRGGRRRKGQRQAQPAPKTDKGDG